MRRRGKWVKDVVVAPYRSPLARLAEAGINWQSSPQYQKDIMQCSRPCARTLIQKGFPMPHAVKTITQALDEARVLMADWVVPEGASDADTLGELVGVLDNRNLNDAMRTLSAPFHQGINRQLLTPRYKVAFDPPAQVRGHGGPKLTQR